MAARGFSGRCYARGLSHARWAGGCVACQFAARSWALCLPFFRACFLVVLQFAAHSYHSHVCYLSAGWSIARRSCRRRRLTILGAGVVHGVDCRRPGFHRLAGQGRSDRELHFRKRSRGVQVRYRFIHSQHTIAKALRVQRIAWRFLGALGLLFFAPARNKYGVAHARSQCACAVTAR